MISAFHRNFSVIFLMITTVSLSPSVFAAATPLSLQDAIALALAENREVKASQNTVDVAEFELKSSYGKFLPQMNAEGKYTAVNDPIEMDLNSIRTAIISSSAGAARIAAATATGDVSGTGLAATTAATNTTRALNAALPSFMEQIQKERYFNASFTVVQPLFAGGKIYANMKAKKEGLASSQEMDRSTRDRITAEVVSRYFSVQLMSSVVEIRKEAVDGFKEHEAYAARLFQEGQLSKANKMRSDVALAEAQREYSKSISNLELAKILLNHSLGGTIREYQLTSPLFMTTQIAPLESYVSRGDEQNPSLKMLEHKGRQLTQKRNAGLGNFLPTASLFGRYELYNRDLTALEPQWAAGVLLRFNIFSGGSDYFDVKATGRELVALEYFTDNARDLVKTEIRKYYHDLNTAKDQYDSLKTSLELAEENLRLNRLAFKEGVATALEVIDAQLALEKVKVDQKKALYEFDVALSQLLRASGDAKEITKLNEELPRRQL